jgi:hypothetical protein
MAPLEAKRTLVKSPPELWAEVSDVAALARHLGEFGEIRITRTEPETVVEWEGDRASGTVRIEPSGWGTRVTLTAEAIAPEPPRDAVPEPAAEPAPHPECEPEPVADPVPEPPRRRGLWARLFRLRAPVDEPLPVVVELEPEPVAVEPEPKPEPEPEPVPEPLADDAAREVLTGVLDTLGAAHHRPFSRG